MDLRMIKRFSEGKGINSNKQNIHPQKKVTNPS